MACLRWCVVTLVAFVWLFSSVCFQVSPQIICQRGCIVTLFAFVWLFSMARFCSYRISYADLALRFKIFSHYQHQTNLVSCVLKSQFKLKKNWEDYFLFFSSSYNIHVSYFSPNQERKSTFSYRWELLFSQRREKTHILVDTRITVLWRELLLEKYTKNGQFFWTTRIAREKSNSRSFTTRKSNSHRRELLFSPFLQTRIV